MPSSLLEPGRTRRRHSREFKAELVAQCRGLGVSVARVAMAHGVNANLLRRWVVESTGQALKPVGGSTAEVVGRTAIASRAAAPAVSDRPFRRRDRDSGQGHKSVTINRNRRSR